MRQIIGTLLFGVVLLLAACGPSESEQSENPGSAADDVAVLAESSEDVAEVADDVPAGEEIIAAAESVEVAESAIADESLAPVESSGEIGAEIASVEDVAAAEDYVAGAETASQVAMPGSAALSVAAGGDLTAEEAAGLQYMREEEKLAHDVYVAMYELWGVNVFNNIAQSEQTHTDAVVQLLNRYGIADPAAGQPAGVFTDPALQALYDQLIAQGSVSAQAALAVGALIEDVDIADLLSRTATTDHEDIALLYGNLQRGSENHLRAFTGLLSRQYGVEYAPQYIGQEVYDQILGSSSGRGNTGAGNGNRARGGPRR